MRKRDRPRRSHALNAALPRLRPNRQAPLRSSAMNKQLIALPERAVEMAGKWGGELLDLGSQISSRGEKWLETGAKLGALRAGTKAATKVVRRYPIVTVATVAGAGLLWYLARRKAKQAENGDGRAAIEGSSRRVD